MNRSQDVPLQQQGEQLSQPPEKSDGFEPLVSIIVPTYNHGQYLGDAIESVLAQTYSNIEIIVVDDGSTDNTREVAASFGDKIQYLWQHNRGLCAARNSGIDIANGTYIGLLDADDMLEPEYCSWLVSALLAFPDAEGIICGYRFVDEKKQPLPQVEARCISPNELHTILLGGNFLVPESIIVHRRCYENVGPFDLSLTACEDWDMWLRISASHKIISTERVLTRHRVLPDSMSSDPMRMLNNRLAVLQKHVGPEPANENDGSVAERRTYGHAYFTSAIEYMQKGDLGNTLEFLRKAASIYPEILASVDTFYELGCSDQAKGSRGYLAELDIHKSSQSVKRILDSLFFAPNKFLFSATHRRKICSVAYWALSLLAYGSGNSAVARGFLWKVFINAPTSLLKRDYVGLVARSILGETGMTQVKYLATKFAPSLQSRSQTSET